MRGALRQFGSKLALLIALALLGFTANAAVGAETPATAALEERISSLNARLLEAGGMAPKDSARRALSVDIAGIASERASAMAALIESSPRRALALALPAAVRDSLARAYPRIAPHLEERGNWSGTLAVVYADNLGTGQSRRLIWLRTAGLTLHLYFAGGEPQRLKSDDLASVRGLRLDRRVAVAGLSQLVAAVQPACSPLGEQKIAALLVKFPGVPEPSLTPEDVRQVLFGASGRSADGYWRDASYGQASASGDVIGWLELDRQYGCSDEEMDALAAAAVRKAGEQADLSQYSRIFVYFPEPEGGCGWSAEGTVGCTSGGALPRPSSYTWLPVNSAWTPDRHLLLAVHEGGHNLGLDHAASRDYGAEALGAPEQGGLRNEYGDPFSTMGNRTGVFGHYNAQQKLQIGWLSQEDVATVEHTGTIRIAPLGSAAADRVRALRVRRIEGQEDWLWLESRQPAGDYESTLPAQAFTGALVHYTDGINGPFGVAEGATDLLDFTPASAPISRNDFDDAALAAGNTWADQWSPRTLQVSEAGADGVTVEVREEACVTLSTTSRQYGPGEESGSVDVTAPADCQWTVISSVPWIAIPAPASGSGSGTVAYTVQANTQGQTRVGTLAIGRRPVQISQAAANLPPVVDFVSPDSGAGPAGAFDVWYDDPNGVFDLTVLRVNFNTSSEMANACVVEYDVYQDSVRLANDAGTGWLGPYSSGQAGLLENSRCRLVEVVSYFGDLYVAVVFKTPGDLKIYASARDQGGLESGWQEVGQWTATANQGPVIGGVSPDSGQGYNQLFTLIYSDPNGADDIYAARAEFVGDSTSCVVDILTNSEWVSEGPAGGYLGSSQVLSGAACSVNLAASSILRNGNEMRIRLAITFNQSFAGTKEVRLSVTDFTGTQAGPERVGAWNVGALPGPTPAIAAEGLVNAASFASGPVAPGEIVTLFGADLGPDCSTARPDCTPDGVVHAYYDSAGYLANVAGNTKVFFNGIQAPMIYSSKLQVSAIVPYDLWLSSLVTTVRLEYEGRVSNEVQVPVIDSAPGIFKFPFLFGQRGQGVIVNAEDNTLNSADNRAARESIVTFFATGEGQTWPLGVDGMLPRTGGWPEPLGEVVVTFGGVPGEVLFKGLTYAGVLQLNVRVPGDAPIGPDVPLILSVAGIFGPDDTTIALK
ncbi:MAG: hypothetical protein ABSD27_02970 [Bryobacteraceae bacterium]